MIDPVIFSAGNFELRWYGAMMGLGLVTGATIMSLRRTRYGLAPNTVSDLAFLGMIFGIIGARAFYVARFWNLEFSQDFPRIFMVWKGGLVFQGGFIFAALAIIGYALLKRLSIGAIGDLIAPALPVAHTFGRIGCLINGCCYGFHPYDGFCAVHYPDSGGVGCFPAQAVEAIGNLMIAGCLLLLEKKNKAPGKRFLLYLMAYTLLRFAVEFLRGDTPKDQIWLGMTPGQYHALWQLPAIIVIFFLVDKFKKSTPAKP